MSGNVIHHVISHDAFVIRNSGCTSGPIIVVVPSVNSHETVRVDGFFSNCAGGISPGKNVPVSGIGLRSHSISGVGSK